MTRSPVWIMKRHAAVLLSLMGLMAWATPAAATMVFSDAFAYATGTLAGRNGGSGWSGPWSGGASVVTGGLPGTYGRSVRISSNASVTSRPMAAAIVTGSATTYYASFIFNANPFDGSNGNYAGITLSGSTNLFMGMPGSSGQLGFSWQNEGDPTVSALSGTSYLMLYEIKPSATPGNTIVSMYATTDLMTSAATLTSGTALVSLEGFDFNFNQVEIAGGYTTGTISLAGLAMATTAQEAVAFTQALVPEPDSLVLAALAAAGSLLGCRFRRRRRVRMRPSGSADPLDRGGGRPHGLHRGIGLQKAG